MKKITLLFLALVASVAINAQCINTSAFGTYTAVNDWNVQTMGTCNYTTEYSTIGGLIVGNDYLIDLTDNSDGAQNYVTVTDVADAVIAHGATPFTWTATATDVRFHWTDDAACATTSSCHTSTLHNLSVTPPACDVPTGISVTTFFDSADISWSAPAIGTPVGYNWEVQPDGVAQGTAGAITGNVATTMDTVLGLASATAYDLFLQTDCGGDGTSTWTAAYSFTTPNPPPANDECVDAIAVACMDVVTGSTVDATDSGNNPAFDVWYSFTGTGTIQDVTVSLCNSGYDTYVRVFDSCGGTEIVGNDDSCGTRSEATFTSDGTSTYYIMIEGYSGTEGTYELAVTCMDNIPPPANDECASATAIALGSTLSGETNAGATQSAGDQPTCDSFGFIADVWYTFVAPASGEVTIQTTLGTASEASIAVYDDCANLDANSLGCTIADGVDGELALTGLTDGATYYVKIWNDGTVAVPPSAGSRTEGSFDVFAADTTTMGINDSSFEGFRFFPNPVQGTLSLRAQDNMQNVAVLNMLGQEVMNVSPNAMSNELDMSALSNGTYFVRVSIDGAVQNFKVIKE